MGALENRLFAGIDDLPASKGWFVQFAARNQVQTSESRMAQAKSGKDYDPQMIVALLNQLDRLRKFRDAVSPLPIRFDDPDQMTQLVNDFETGRLTITVARPEDELLLIRRIFQIEFTADQTLFQGVLNGDIQKTRQPSEAVAIADEITANAAASVLRTMGRACRVIDGRMRVSESKLAKSLATLGFAERVSQ